MYSAGEMGSFVENPNELIIIDLTKPQLTTNPVSRTLRSFGGLPQRITFSEQLNLPTGLRRLLIVETDVDVSLLDLEHLDREEITVRLTNGTTTARVEPSAIAVDPGGRTSDDWAKIAIRTKQEPSVIVLELGPLPASDVGTVPNDYRPVVNIVGLDTVPSDIAFVTTDAGPRLAALEPNSKKAALIDTSTTVTSTVDMPADYGKLSLVTKQVGDAPAGGSDVALLWGGPSSKYAGVAFWSLGKSVGQAYRSIETLSDVGTAIKQVIDIPAPHASLKLLIPSNAAGTAPIHLLDLASRTASPLVVSTQSLNVTVARDGQRIWLYQSGGMQAAVLSLDNYHPRNLSLSQSIAELFDIQNQQGGRTMLALDRKGNSAATLLDALAPDDATGQMYAGILQGGF